jgi:hypothetical protein
MRPIEDEKGIIADWSLNLFRERPDVVRFRTVMGRTKKEPSILRAWAYKADKPEKTVSKFFPFRTTEAIGKTIKARRCSGVSTESDQA